MRTVVILPLLAAVALVGCNKAAETKPKPGHWDYTMKLLSFDAPGMPPELKTAMESQMKTQVQTFQTCLTPEQAAKEDSSVIPQGSAPPGCSFGNYSMKDGKIDATLNCDKSASGMKSMTMSGTYGPEAMNLQMAAAMEMMPGKQINMTMAMDGKRAGECTGKETAAPAAPTAQ